MAPHRIVRLDMHFCFVECLKATVPCEISLSLSLLSTPTALVSSRSPFADKEFGHGLGVLMSFL